VHRLVPFVIRLVERKVADCALQPLRLKLDPGSKATGLALVRDTEHVEAETGGIQRGACVLNLFELVHRGKRISEALSAGRQMRRRCRPGVRTCATARRACAAARLVGTVTAAPGRHLAGLGDAHLPLGAGDSTELRAGLLRYGRDAQPGHQSRGVQARRTGGLRAARVPAEKWGRKCTYWDASGVALQVEHVLGPAAAATAPRT
jgi:hypothetical protein